MYYVGSTLLNIVKKANLVGKSEEIKDMRYITYQLVAFLIWIQYWTSIIISLSFQSSRQTSNIKAEIFDSIFSNLISMDNVERLGPERFPFCRCPTRWNFFGMLKFLEYLGSWFVL